FTLAEKEGTVALPNSVDPIDAATISIAGLTAYQSIVPKVKKGDKVFINSGSGGTGVFGIQIAKALGCHVTTTCSTANVELCRSLGADDILDYKNKTIVKALKASKHKFDYVVDNPAFLGGAKRKHMGFFAKLKYEELKQIRAWMKEGKVKAIIDQRFPFEQAPKAFEKLKTGRAKGKIVVDVASDTYGEA
ncbi:hypothetical protein LTR28_012666, partial [Elasticomyces elasticus]